MLNVPHADASLSIESTENQVAHHSHNEMSQRVRDFDWTSTSLGLQDQWSQSLKTAVQIVLDAPFPHVILWGPNLIQIYNDAYRDLMGNKHPAGLGQPSRDCWWEVWQINEPIYRRSLAGESVLLQDLLRPINRYGVLEDAWFTLACSPIRNEAGHVAGVFAVMFETTERRMAEEALRANEVRLQTVSDVVPQVIWTNTANGRADYFNQRWYEYTGLDYEGSEGLGWQAVVHPKDASASALRWQKALATGDVFDTEYRLRGGDGRYRWFIGRNVPLKNAVGEVTGWFGTATDIEDRKQAEAAQQKRDNNFHLMVDGARDYAMFLLDRKGERVVFWSKGAEELFGWAEHEMLGQPAAKIFSPEDRDLGALQQETARALAAGQANDTRWHQRKDGSLFWASGLLMRLDDAQGNLIGFAKVARDATDQKQDEEVVQQAVDAVVDANLELEQRVQERTLELETKTIELAEMSLMRQELLRQVVTAQEEERGRISRDLHDDTGQQLTALLLGLSNLRPTVEGAKDADAQTLLSNLQTLAGEVAQKSHHLSFSLRPTTLDDLGLMGTLQNYTEEWSRWSGMYVEIEAIGIQGAESAEAAAESEATKRGRLPSEVETTIYRVVQEALTNILRYATGVDGHKSATIVTIVLQHRSHDDTGNEVRAVIEDDGPGFDVEAVLNQPPGKRRLGIFGMQERARLVGGTLDVESEIGEGTSVFLRIPL